jgi:hypothetical protein
MIDNIPDPEVASSYIKIGGKGGYIKKELLPAELQGESTLSVYQREDKIWVKYKKEEEFSFSSFIMEHLAPFDIDNFFASREKTLGGKKVRIPDKALLYSFVIQKDAEGKDMLPFLYWLGKGYTDSYLLPDSYFESPELVTLEPFQNSIWHACMEGCAQMICCRDGEKRAAFFETTYIKRLETYFYIYILVLHQYYGLLKLDEGISKLPNDISGYNQKGARKQLKEYRQKLNFFLMNSVFLRVSHVTHHNMYYDYLRQAYGLEQLTSLMLEKVTLMNDMVEQWHQKQKNKNVLGFTITGGIFAFIQTFNNILGIYDYFAINRWISRGSYSLLSLLVSVLAGFIIWLIIKDWGEC